MNDEDIDPALAELVEEIEAAESGKKDTKDTTSEVEHAEDSPEKKEKEEIEDFENSIEEPPEIDEYEDELSEDIESVIADVEVVEANPVNSQEAKLASNIIGMVERHFDSTEKMFNEADEDRKRIDDIVGILLPKIQDGDYKSADVAAIAALIQTKSDISRNRSSMMDSVAKLLAALKNNDSIDVKTTTDNSLSQDEVKGLLGKRK